MTFNLRSSRRDFLRRVGVAGFTFPFVAGRSWAVSPNEVLRHASFGASGMAAADLESITRHPQVRMVAVAEVDPSRANELKHKFPDARVCQDWRRLLDEERKLDSVNVSTPDHWKQRVEGCLGNGTPSANFDYSGPLTEAVLLGGVATHYPQTTLEWHAAQVKFKNVAEANKHVRRKHRKGWEVKGLS